MADEKITTERKNNSSFNLKEFGERIKKLHSESKVSEFITVEE